MQHPQTRKKNILTILKGAEKILCHRKKLAANSFSLLQRLPFGPCKDARDVDGITLKMTFLVHKKGHESTARASFLHSHKGSGFTGEKKRGINRGRKSKLLSAGGEPGQM